MLGSLVLAAGFGLLPGIPAADQVVCPPSHRGAPPIPAQWFAPDPPYGTLPDAKPTTTGVTDGLNVALPGAQWFQEYVGGASNGVYALYDMTTGTYLQCGYEDTAHFFGAWHVPISWVPRAVPALAASIHVHTARGIAFGATPEQVEAIYGRSTLQPGGDGSYLVFEKHGKDRYGNDFVTRTTFYFADGKLVGIERLAGV
jgi:hypothetical protein